MNASYKRRKGPEHRNRGYNDHPHGAVERNPYSERKQDSYRARGGYQHTRRYNEGRGRIQQHQRQDWPEEIDSPQECLPQHNTNKRKEPNTNPTCNTEEQRLEPGTSLMEFVEQLRRPVAEYVVNYRPKDLQDPLLVLLNNLIRGLSVLWDGGKREEMLKHLRRATDSRQETPSDATTTKEPLATDKRLKTAGLPVDWNEVSTATQPPL